MNMNQKGFAPIIIALIVALLLGVGGYAVVKQRENKKTEVKLISTDIFKNATYRIAFSTGKARGIPTEFTMTGGFSSNSIKDFPLCNISGLGIKNELAIATIDQGQARGVVAIDCSYGASFIDVFLAAFKNLNGVPVQTDAVDLRLHPDLSSRNLSQVGVKQIVLESNGVLTVTALVIPDALRNAPTVQQSASESVTISYSLDNQGKLTPTQSTPTTDSQILNWKTYTYLSTESGILPNMTFKYPSIFTVKMYDGIESYPGEPTNEIVFNEGKDGYFPLNFNSYSVLPVDPNTPSPQNTLSFDREIKGEIPGNLNNFSFTEKHFTTVGGLRAIERRATPQSNPAWLRAFYYIELPNKHILGITTGGKPTYVYDTDAQDNSTADKIISSIILK